MQSRMVSSSFNYKVFYALMVQYIEKNQYLHGQYCCWKWIFAYSMKSLYFQRTEQSSWYSGWASCTWWHWWMCCFRSGLRWGRLWENFFPFLADKVAMDCGLEGSDGDSMINDIGCQHLCVISSKNFKLNCTVVRL